MRYVYRDGKIVPKTYAAPANRSDLPIPQISRIEAYESPITGKDITSWGERNRELREHDAYDPRDLPADHTFTRGRDAQAAEAPAPSIWKDKDDG